MAVPLLLLFPFCSSLEFLLYEFQIFAHSRTCYISPVRLVSPLQTFYKAWLLRWLLERVPVHIYRLEVLLFQCSSLNCYLCNFRNYELNKSRTGYVNLVKKNPRTALPPSRSEKILSLYLENIICSVGSLFLSWLNGYVTFYNSHLLYLLSTFW